MVSVRSALVRYLQTNGPSTGAELPRESSSPSLTAYERKEGVQSFNPSISTSNSSTSSRPGKTKPVYFLKKEHDPRVVIREWVQANPQILDAVAPRAFLQAVNGVGPKFAEVSKLTARDLYGEAAWQDAFGGSSGGNEKGSFSQEIREKLLEADPDEVFGDDG